MKKRLALHLLILASAAGVFTATAIARLNGSDDRTTPTTLPDAP